MIEQITSFPEEVIKELKYYVYRLIDPRNGETFYVGKGHGNRVFAHIKEEIKSENENIKLNRIREIKLDGFEVEHIIHRHGMEEGVAEEVESALIDAYPGLTNIASGVGSSSVGVMHAKQVIKNYQAEIAEFKHKIILINVNKTSLDTSVSLYDATRYAWKINLERAKKVELVLAVTKGIIIAVYEVFEWLPSTIENFPNHILLEGRFGFNGKEAQKEISDFYIGKRIPDEYRKKGAANPIKYTFD